jgi:signal transduction histidine kinase/CheY-like chemotaxis protein
MTYTEQPRFGDELGISAKLPIAACLGAGIVVAAIATYLLYPVRAHNYVLILWSVAAALWLVNGWHPRLGRVCAVVAWSFLLVLARAWFEEPGMLVWLCVPVVLSAPLVGSGALLPVAAAESLLLVAAVYLGLGGATPSEALHAVLAVWVVYALMALTLGSTHQLASWSWGHYTRACRILREARDRQVELKQSLQAAEHVNRQLALANERLAVARRAAEVAERSKASFVAKVSHEFRTPLNMIIGLSDLCISAPHYYGTALPQELMHDLEVIYRNSKHLASLVDDVLDLSQVEAGRLSLHREHVDLREVVSRAVEVVRPLLEKKALYLELDMPPSLPEVYCDQTRVRQVILNLLSNAARFTDQGGMKVQIVPNELEVTVSVRDTGPGIGPQDMTRIFEPFEQGMTRLWQDRKGSGLGLSISKQFVELHGGRMGVKSTLSEGSTFWFTLPISPLLPPSAGPAQWLSSGFESAPARADLTNARLENRVIVCDPTGELRGLLARYADDLDLADVRTVTEAVQELERCAAQTLIVNAPDADSLLDVIDEARAAVPDLPVLGYCVAPSWERAVSAGAMAFLRKPLDRTGLRDALEAIGGEINRVLVVDDDPEAVYLLTRMLMADRPDLSVVSADSGRDALDRLHTNPPDLLLLDVLLPDMSGWQVLAAIRRDPALHSIPVLIVSAQDARDQPVESGLLVAAMGRGLSISKLLRCSRSLASLLMLPD